MPEGFLQEAARADDDTSSAETADGDNAPEISMGGDANDNAENGGAAVNAARNGGGVGAGANEADSEGTASDATVSDTEGPAAKGDDVTSTPKPQRGTGGGESDATISDSDATQTDNEEKRDDSGTESDNEDRKSARMPRTPNTQAKYDEQQWEPEAREMHQLWKEDHQQWLERSKVRWREERLKRRRLYQMYLNAPTQHHAYQIQQEYQRHLEAASASASTRLPKEKERTPRVPKPRAPRLAKPKIRTGGLKMLIEEGLLQPGTNVLFILYMNQTFVSSLDEEGYIVWEGQKFGSPSAWSIFVKRLANPSKKADDGWKSVRYAPSGESLELLKDRLALMQVRGDDAAKEAAASAQGSRNPSDDTKARRGGPSKSGKQSEQSRTTGQSASNGAHQEDVDGGAGVEEQDEDDEGVMQIDEDAGDLSGYGEDSASKLNVAPPLSPPHMAGQGDSSMHDVPSLHNQEGLLGFHPQKLERTDWIQCDRCDKWREIPLTEAEKVDNRNQWYCEHQGPWLPNASCSDPEGKVPNAPSKLF
mmetsp:Transcript_35675/g.77868  ORF Transcript_35675/g.77868 Transcript_35675/m.77868 type:complete len:534 (-) Transcript_35675:190-1791(-)